MLRLVTLSLLTLTGSLALAERTTTQPGRVAKDAFKRQTGKQIDHTLETRDHRNVVLGWDGPARGPGATRAYLMVVKGGADHESMVANTVISKDLAASGAGLVREHMKALGLSGKIELGDHLAKHAEVYDHTRLAQQPVSREAGSLRYTVTEANGTQHRFLVRVNTQNLLSGSTGVLGQVVRDNDSYGQHPY